MFRRPDSFRVRVTMRGLDRVLLLPGRIRLHSFRGRIPPAGRPSNHPFRLTIPAAMRGDPEQRNRRSVVIEALGAIAAAISVGFAILDRPGRRRAAMLLLALALVPTLIVADQWNATQVAELRGSPALLAGA